MGAFAGGFAALVVLATLNREINGVLTVLAWFAFFPRRWRLGLAYAALAAATYGAIRLYTGVGGSFQTVESVWLWNTEGWRLSEAALLTALLLPLFGACLVGWKRAPLVLRRLTLLLMAVYLPLFFVFAAWNEVRLLMIPLILILPMLPRIRVSTTH